MKKLITFFLLICACSLVAQNPTTKTQPAPKAQQEQVTTTDGYSTPTLPQRNYDLVDTRINAHEKRVEDLHQNLNMFFAFFGIGVSILTFLIGIIIAVKYKGLSREYENQKKTLQDNYESQKNLMQEKLTNLDRIIKAAEEKANNIISNIEERVDEAFLNKVSEELKLRLPATNEEASKEIVEEVHKQVQKIHTKKSEKEYTANDWFLKGYEAQKKGDYTNAILYYEKAIELNPKEAAAYNNLGATLDALGEHERAIEKYKKAGEINPKDDDVYYNWGNALSHLESSEGAIEKYNRAIEINPKYEEAYNNLGYILDDLGKYEEAIEKYNKVIEINPKNENGYIGVSHTLNNQHKYSEAISPSQIAIKLAPQEPHGYTNLANAYTGLKKFQEAVDNYFLALKQDSQFMEAYTNCDIALDQLKETDPKAYEQKVAPYKELLTKNKDLPALANDDKFKALLSKYS